MKSPVTRTPPFDILRRAAADIRRREREDFIKEVSLIILSSSVDKPWHPDYIARAARELYEAVMDEVVSGDSEQFPRNRSEEK